ncbi:MAG: 50S ribosomal protein L17 [Deltaproteobacteria bacterium]|nr:50S ribosomal protein L17 [Deltaproteobacteria bacterium]
MRHAKAGRQLSRNSAHRRALLRNLATSLFKYEQIETTDAKAKELRPIAEKMITLAKRGDLHARRQALAYIQEKAVVHRLFDELKDRYMDRQGGYLRIIKKGTRKGDGAPISIVQLLPSDEKGKSRKKKAAKKKAAKPKTRTTDRKEMTPESVKSEQSAEARASQTSEDTGEEGKKSEA